jgi:DNA-binding Lrp family transcriptional regulator
MKKLVSRRYTKTTSKTVGQTTQIEEVKFSVAREATEFIMIFPESIKVIHKLNTTDLSILYYLAFLSDYNSTIIKMDSTDRKEMMDSLGITPQHLSRCLAKLKELGFIYGERGRYELNPYFVWKGSLKSRYKIIKELDLNRESNEPTEQPRFAGQAQAIEEKPEDLPENPKSAELA